MSKTTTVVDQSASASKDTSITSIDDLVETAVPTAKVAKVHTAHSDEVSGDYVDITINPKEGDQSSGVFLGLNGDGTLVPVGSRVSIRAELIEVLENTKQTVYEPQKDGTMKERQISRFTYTVHGPSKAKAK